MLDRPQTSSPARNNRSHGARDPPARLPHAWPSLWARSSPIWCYHGLGSHHADAPMPHELRLRSLARADRHARTILTYVVAGVPSLAASRGRTERWCRADCGRSRGSRARRQRMLLQAAGPQRRGSRFGAAAPPAGAGPRGDAPNAPGLVRSCDGGGDRRWIAHDRCAWSVVRGA